MVGLFETVLQVHSQNDSVEGRGGFVDVMVKNLSFWGSVIMIIDHLTSEPHFLHF